MKLLLTSGGVSNASMQDALVDMLGKPIAESSALCIPTAIYTMPGGFGRSWGVITGVASTPLCDLGWKSLGVLELTALPSLQYDWAAAVRETDALLVGGGDAAYLCHWMRESGLADLFPSLSETVYVGVSGGSMVLTPRIGVDFMGWIPPNGDEDRTLGLVDFSMFPHLDHPNLPENTMADAELWAAELSAPAYALDDQTAIKVVDGKVEVISEGHWRQF